MMKKIIFGILLLFVLVYIAPLGLRPLIIPDETRYAEVPREMLATSDWVVPHLNGIRYFEKPAPGYWPNTLSMLIFGENGFSIRLPCALASGITALFVFLLMRSFGQGRREALLAAGILLTCAEFFGVGTFSVLDPLLTCSLTGALFFFYLATRAENFWKKQGWLALFGLCCGLAFLIKGFLAFAVPVIVIVPFMFWERRWKELFTMCWTPLIAAVLVSLPWALAIHFREADFWNYFFWDEHVNRFTSASGNQKHPSPIWYFIPVLLGGALPWTLLFPAAALGFKRGLLKHSLVRYALCWLVIPFLFFSASSGKLGTYILPCFPALAMLMSMGLWRYFDARREDPVPFFDHVAKWFGILLLVVLPLFVINQVTGFPLTVYGAGETWKWIAVSFAVALWSVLLIRSAALKNPAHKLGLFCVGPLVAMSLSHALLPELVADTKAPGEFLAKHASKVKPETTLVSYKDPFQAVCFTFKRSDVLIFGGEGELKYGLDTKLYPDAAGRFIPDAEGLIKIIGEKKGKGGVALVIKKKTYEKDYKKALPEPQFIAMDGNFCFMLF